MRRAVASWQVRFIVWLFSGLISGGLIAGVAGCGGSAAPIGVTVTSSSTTVDGTDSVKLTASVANDKNASGVSWSVTGGGSLSGQTSSAATYTAPTATSASQTITVTATSVADSTKTASTTLTVPAAPSITTSSLTAAAVGSAYSVTLAGSGGISPYTWSLTGGTLPASMTLTSAGVLSGTPMATDANTLNLTFKLTDSGTATALTATKTLSLTINPAPAIAFTTTALTNATYNVAYSASVAATGGAGALTYSLASGPLPTGLSLSSAGVISGTPTVAGSFPITVKAADAYGDSMTQSYTVKVVYPPVMVTAATLPTGYVNSTYTQTTLTATGGSGTGYTWALSSGSSLPAGLSLSSTGVISGKPTTAGTTNFSVTATDSATNTGTGSFTITVNAAVSITTATTLPIGYVNLSYSQQLAATGGSGTGYAWTVASGSSLPAGLTLSSAGVLSGKPTTAATSTFSLTVTDSVMNTATTAFTLTVAPGVSITTTSLPSGYQGTAYVGATLAATGGSGTGYTWSWAAAGSSSLPAGLSLSSAGAISGTPTQAGTFSVVITVTDSVGNTTSVTLSILVEATLSVTTTTLSSGTVGASYSQTLTATGGSGTGYTWSTDTTGATSLAAIGLSLSSAGVVSGSSPTAGTATFTVTVKDSQSHTATANLSVTVYAALTITTSTLPTAYTNTAYSQALVAAGGSGTGYSWSVTAGASSLAAVNLAVSSTGVVSGTPLATGTASFTVQVTDSANNKQTASFSITVVAPIALPIGNPSTLPAATVNQSYTGSLSVTGGVGPYTWTVNASAMTTTPQLISNGLSAAVSGAGNNTLSITGTPTTVTDVYLANVIVKDSTGAQAGPNTYTITVNSAGSQVSGQIMLTNYCGSGLTMPPITVSINTSPVQTTTTDGSGNYSFASIPNGTYTITPSITGPSSVFYPASASVTVNNGAVTGENFQVALGYTVSGTVSYSGSHTGQVYLSLVNNNCGGNNGPGTSITAPGSFTIHGVSPGTYTLAAGMDILGYGATNASDPSGNASVTVGTANVTNANVAMGDPTAVTLSSGPKLKNANPINGGLIVNYKPITNSNGLELATSYTLQWSTSSTFSSVTGSKTFAATGGQGGADIWIVSGLTNGAVYYLRAEGMAGSSTSSWSSIIGPYTVGAPTTGNTVSGTVTFTGTATGPLYVGFYDLNTNAVYADVIANPVSPQAYTVQVPSGTSYYFFGIIDQNNDGIIDPGDITNTHDNANNQTTTVSGNATMNLTLQNANSTPMVTTQSIQSTNTSGTVTTYNLGLVVREGNKLPVAVQVLSGPNILIPVDVSMCTTCGTPQYDYYVGINGVQPNVGDTYSFKVTYSDQTSETLSASVTAVLSAFPTNLAPTGAGTSTTPTFTWTDPTNASSYIYQFYLWDQNGNTIWQIPGNNSKVSGFTSSITSITWGTDPTGDTTNTPTVTSLTSGATYNWSIAAQDANGNSAQTQVQYIP